MSEPTDPNAPDPFPADTFVLGGPSRRRRRTPLWVAGALVLVLTAAGVIVLTRPGGPDVALSLDFREGGTQRYRLEIAMDGNVEAATMQVPFEMEMTEVIAIHVVDVDDAGAATLEVEIESLTGSVDGIPLPPEAVSEATDTRMTIKPDGRVTTEDGLVFQAPTSGPGPMTSTTQLFPLLPDYPVGPGDSWEKDYTQSIPFAEGALEVTTDNEFLRYEEIDGVRAAVIQSRASIPLDFSINLRKFAKLAGQPPTEPLPDVNVRYGGEMNGGQTVWLDPELGEVLRSDSTADMEFTITTPSVAEGFTPAGLEAKFSGRMAMHMERL